MITLWWTDETTIQNPDGGDATEINFSSLQLDILESESSTFEAKVTSSPIERGVPVVDHIIPQQGKISLSVIVSDSPMNTLLADGSILVEGGIIQAPYDQIRSSIVYLELQRLRLEGIVVDVEGLRFDVESYAIEKVSETWDADLKGALACTIDLVEVLFAETEDVAAPSPRVERARRNRNSGNQQPETPSDEDLGIEVEPQDRSVAVAALDLIAGNR